MAEHFVLVFIDSERGLTLDLQNDLTIQLLQVEEHRFQAFSLELLRCVSVANFQCLQYGFNGSNRCDIAAQDQASRLQEVLVEVDVGHDVLFVLLLPFLPFAPSDSGRPQHHLEECFRLFKLQERYSQVDELWEHLVDAQVLNFKVRAVAISHNGRQHSADLLEHGL